jgi:GTP-binding protein YchF
VDIALIGLASSGKTTLLKALAAGHLPHHAAVNEPLTAVVKVPDERLDRLATMVQAKKTTYLELRIHDYPSFAVGKKGPPPQLLGSLATNDLLVHVVRAFGDESVPHPQGSVDPERDIAALDLELAFADLGIIERRLERLTVEMRSLAAGARGNQEREMALLQRLKAALEQEKPLRTLPLAPDEKTVLGGFNLLTLKPLLIVLNVDEGNAQAAGALEARYREKLAGAGFGVIAIAAKAEADMAELSDEEAAEFRKELGLAEQPAAARVLSEVVSLLGLISFFTAGPQDTHAWSVPSGTPAVKAAGRIHSDIERGFIRAEVIGWQELLEAGSQAEAKRRGLLRIEGKAYEVKDGDVINVLFNV